MHPLIRCSIPVLLLMQIPAGQLKAQKAYRIPFGSINNVLEFRLNNHSSLGVRLLHAELKSSSGGIHINPDQQELRNFSGGSERTIRFVFDAGKAAVIGSPDTLTLEANAGSLGKWTTSVLINVLPPERFSLEQNYPNPFNAVTVIGFLVPVHSHVSLTIFNAIGMKLATLVDDARPPGYHSVRWNAADIPSGVYFCRLAAGDFSTTRKLVLMR